MVRVNRLSYLCIQNILILLQSEYFFFMLAFQFMKFLFVYLFLQVKLG